ncbi:MAG: DinB family protein [Chloroflexia bacterium]|nr:DinB family protein [Chloroflexia bacterium]
MRIPPLGRAQRGPLLAVSPADQAAGGEQAEAHRQDDAPVADRAEGAAREPVKSPSRSPEEILRAIAGYATELDRLVDGKPDEVLTQPAQDGGWGMVEIVSHLRDWEEVGHERLWMMLDQHHPRLTAYDDSLWAIERNYREQVPRQVLARFRELRAALVERVEVMDEADWDRGAVHPGRGEITIHWLLDRMVDHDAAHLEQARDVLG